MEPHDPLSPLENSGQLLLDVLRSSLDVIIATDLHRNIRLFNPAAETSFGYAAEEVLGAPVDQLYADPAEMHHIIDGIAREGTYTGEVLNRARDGSTFTSFLSAAAMRDPQGRTTGYMGVSRDITEMHRAEAALARSELRYRDLVDAANSIILRWDAQGRIRFLNEFGQRFFGYTAAEIIGQPVVGTIVPPSETTGRDLGALMEDIHLHPERYANNENQNMRRDGSLVWVSWTNKRILWDPAEGPEILSIGNDITRLKEVEFALQEKSLQLAEANSVLLNSNEVLRAADRMKSVFIASISHELRTPLNSIIGFTGILLQQLPGPLNLEQQKQLGIVRDSSWHLLGLINEVLDLSKIEAGRVDLFPEDVVLRVLADEVLAALAPAAQPRGLALHNDVPEGIRLYTDPTRMRQVLLNLAGNAVKFTEAGEVRIQANQHAAACKIQVVDTGPGIPEPDLPRLFQPFQQVDMALTRKHAGTGLGLYLTRKIVELLGGDVAVASTYGHGATFTVNLPLRTQVPSARDA